MNYKELIVWQKAHTQVIQIIKSADQFKGSYAGEMIFKQLLRAATSIGANIAEGHGRHEGKEYLRYLQMAYGSANEVDNWLNVLGDCSLISTKLVSELIQCNEEILKILVTIIKKLRSREK